jgi:hypothetical protein
VADCSYAPGSWLTGYLRIPTVRAVARLLSGMARPPRNSSGQLDFAHIAFSTAILVLLISVWWSTFCWQDYENWTITEFFLLCAYVSLFYAVHAFYCVLEPVVIYVRDGELSPWYYVPMIVHLFLLSILGIFLRMNMFDRLFSFWLIIVNVIWIFLARFSG